MNSRAPDNAKAGAAYESVQTAAFTEEVEKGVYSAGFEHSSYLTAFFDRVMDEVLPALPSDGFSVLDAGCGTGIWLHYLHQTVLPRHGRQGAVSMFGFDLTPAMADVAAQNLAAVDSNTRIQVGSVADEKAYSFPEGPRAFDLVFSFDVVQQLPVAMQFDAVRCLIGATRPGGRCVIFDHDNHSPYGRKMAFKKFVTARLGIPLVPRFYCNAKYPPLDEFRRRIEREGLGTASIVMPADGKKRALIIRVPETEDDT